MDTAPPYSSALPILIVRREFIRWNIALGLEKLQAKKNGERVTPAPVGLI
jgi:hypothetical protein